jgi:hypothetical protein
MNHEFLEQFGKEKKFQIPLLELSINILIETLVNNINNY